jgi:hypothetical protein
MKLSQSKINEYIDLYLSDMQDYDDDFQNYKIAEGALNSFKSIQLENDNEDAINSLIEATNNSEHKDIFKDLYEYITAIHQ